MISEELTRVAVRWWWLIALSVVGTVVLSTQLVGETPDTYESTGSYVVRARASTEGDLVRATGTQIAGTEINATLARIAESDAIEDAARLVVDTTQYDARGLKVDASIVPGTNIVDISVTSRDPELSLAMATAVGDEAITFIDDLAGVFVLTKLDNPKLPKNPQAVGFGTTTLLAVFFGGGLGLVLALVADRLFPRSSVDLHPEFDDVHSEEELHQRLREELSRIEDGEGSLRVLVLRITDPHGRNGRTTAPLSEGDLLLVARVLKPTLRDHDFFANLGTSEPGTFVALMPNLSAADAKGLLATWESVVSALLSHTSADVTTSEASYERGAFVGDAPAEQIVRSL